MDRAVDAVNLATPGADLSLWGLFVEADIVVKLVMLGLLAASVWVWAVVFEKWSSLRKVNREADGFEDRFWSGGSLDELFDRKATNPTHPMAAVFGAAMGEWRRSVRVAGADIAPQLGPGAGGPRHHRHGTARDGSAGALDDLPGLGRRHRAVHRPVRHRVGDHAQLLGHRGDAQHQSRGCRPGHRRGVVRHRDRPGGGNSRRCWPTTRSATIWSRFAARLEGFGAEFSAILSRQSEERA